MKRHFFWCKEVVAAFFVAQAVRHFVQLSRLLVEAGASPDLQDEQERMRGIMLGIDFYGPYA